MSMNSLTIDGEFRYIAQWFNEWSELQRDDFVPIIVKYITCCQINDDDYKDEVETITTPVNMNGLPNDLQFNGRPMSLFQCRIKLFNQWNQRWPTEFKEKLQQKITEIDGKVGEKIKVALNPNTQESLTNGYASKEQDQQRLEQFKANVAGDASEVETMVLNDPMTEVLNNETSVDDIETNENINNIAEQPLLNNTLETNDNEVVDDGNSNNDNNICSNNTRHTHDIKEHVEPVEQVILLQNIKINEENSEVERDHEDVTVSVEQQQPLQSATVSANPVDATPAVEVPLVA